MNTRFPKLIVSVLAIVIVVLHAFPAPVPAQEPPAMPLAEPGPYGVGISNPTFIDESREGRRLLTLIWYPAQAGEISYVLPKSDAEPDMTGVPYPLIIYSHGLWDTAGNTLTLGPHLASHGFVVASIQHPEKRGSSDYSPGIIDRPLDVLFVLDHLTALSAGEWAGLIDTANVGVAGISYGGTTALRMSGARVDPGYLRDWCVENDPGAEPTTEFSGSPCQVFFARWDEVTTYYAQFGSPEEGKPWPPLTDERIRAALPIAPCWTPLMSEIGMAADVLPTLIVFPENEGVCIPSDGARVVYDHLGSTDRYLLTLLGAGHFAASEDVRFHPVLRQVAMSFFGRYLQGHEDYAQYLTAEYVGSLPLVAWESSLE